MKTAAKPKPANFPKSMTPIGSVIIYAGHAVTGMPVGAQGWMVCDGRTLQAQQYPALFAAIGYSYGGSADQFNIPNLPPPFAGPAQACYIINFI